ncbi:hypothetical protein AOQ84DRAFT_224251, partial [Glonium stellatum]
MSEAYLSFLVPREHVKTVKSALETTQRLNRAIKIHPAPHQSPTNLFIIPSTLPALTSTSRSRSRSLTPALLQTLNLSALTPLAPSLTLLP